MAEKHEHTDHDHPVSGPRFIEGWHGGRIPVFASHEDADIHSVGSGGWHDGGTWDKGRAPGAGERVCICANDDVWGAGQMDAKVIAVEGTLRFANADTELWVETLQVLQGGYLNMQDARTAPLRVWWSSQGRDRERDPDWWGGGLLVLGSWRAVTSGGLIVFETAEQAFRGHAAALMDANVWVDGIHLLKMGRTNTSPIGPANPVGRYPMHFHHLSTRDNVFQNCRVEDSPGWGISIHSSHGNVVRNNTFVRCAGAAVVTEAGDETDNVIEDNVFEDCVGGGSIEEGKEGSGIWAKGHNNIFRRNRSVRCKKGFTLWREPNTSLVQGGAFEDNVADDCELVLDGRGVSIPITGLTGINCKKDGVRFEYSKDFLQVSGLRLVGTGQGTGFEDRGQVELKDFHIEGFETQMRTSSPWGINRVIRHMGGTLKGGKASIRHESMSHYRYANTRTEFINLSSEPAAGGIHVSLITGPEGGSARPFNTLFKDEVYLLGWQKQAGQNLRLYWPVQAKDALLPRYMIEGGGPEQPGIDITPNITNGELYDRFGLAMMGDVAPGIPGLPGFVAEGEWVSPSHFVPVAQFAGEPPSLAPDTIYDGFIASVKDGVVRGRVWDTTGVRPKGAFYLGVYDDPTKEYWWSDRTALLGTDSDGSFEVSLPERWKTGTWHLRLLTPGVHHQRPTGVPHTIHEGRNILMATTPPLTGAFLEPAYRDGYKPVYAARTETGESLVASSPVYQRMAEGGQIRGVGLAGYISTVPGEGLVPVYVIYEGGNTYTFTVERPFWANETNPPVFGYVRTSPPPPVEPEEPEPEPEPTDDKDKKIMELQQAVANLEQAKVDLLAAIGEEQAKVAAAQGVAAQAIQEKEEADRFAEQAIRERQDALDRARILDAQKDSLVQVAESAVSVLSKVLAEMEE